MSSKTIKNGYQKRKANEKLMLMKVANDSKQKKLSFFIKKEPDESFIENVIDNIINTVLLELEDNDMFIYSSEKSAGTYIFHILFYSLNS